MTNRGYRLIATVLVCVFVAQTALPAQPVPKTVEQFDKVKLHFLAGEDSKDLDVVLRFELDQLVIARKSGRELRRLPYAEIKRATYASANRLVFTMSLVPVLADSVPIASHPPAWTPSKEESTEAVQEAAAFVILRGIFSVVSAPFVGLRRKKHWLEVRASNTYVILRLSKTNYQALLTTFEARTGVKVETLSADE
ncbi:MAG: hypothetical protein HY710_04015 [Candidatus Latescibacteria bacterium]|nr:hypothetical protein [Candidatus Latescibacterota bacterium]